MLLKSSRKYSTQKRLTIGSQQRGEIRIGFKFQNDDNFIA